jgi:hypothetical protein
VAGETDAEREGENGMMGDAQRLISDLCEWWIGVPCSARLKMLYYP